MKTLIKLFLLIFPTVLLFHSCKEKCGDCFTPPSPFVFEVVDSTSGANLFQNGTLNPDSLRVTDQDGKNVLFTFLSENDIDLIRVNSIGWQSETVDYTFKYSNDTIFGLHVVAERLTQDCCSFTRYDEITISGAEYTYDTGSGIYTIKY